MSNSTQPIPAGLEHLIPHLVCDSAAEAIEFYKKAFGAEELHRMPEPGGKIMHAAIRIGKTSVFLADDFPEHCGGKARRSPFIATSKTATPPSSEPRTPAQPWCCRPPTCSGEIATEWCSIRLATSGASRRTSRT
jgi:hypothetical protein